MILGIGSDLCDIRRVEKAMARFGDRFLERVFTEAERARALGVAPRSCKRRPSPNVSRRRRPAPRRWARASAAACSCPI
jgi:hypothetical protein